MFLLRYTVVTSQNVDANARREEMFTISRYIKRWERNDATVIGRT